MTEHLCRFAAMGSECSVTITADDLETAEALFLGNSARGLLPCRIVRS